MKSIARLRPSTYRRSPGDEGAIADSPAPAAPAPAVPLAPEAAGARASVASSGGWEMGDLNLVRSAAEVAFNMEVAFSIQCSSL